MKDSTGIGWSRKASGAEDIVTVTLKIAVPRRKGYGEPTDRVLTLLKDVLDEFRLPYLIERADTHP